MHPTEFWFYYMPIRGVFCFLFYSYHTVACFIGTWDTEVTMKAVGEIDPYKTSIVTCHTAMRGYSKMYITADATMLSCKQTLRTEIVHPFLWFLKDQIAKGCYIHTTN